AIARNPRLIAHNRPPRSRNAVEQRRLAHIRPSADRHQRYRLRRGPTRGHIELCCQRPQLPIAINTEIRVDPLFRTPRDVLFLRHNHGPFALRALLRCPRRLRLRSLLCAQRLALLRSHIGHLRARPRSLPEPRPRARLPMLLAHPLFLVAPRCHNILNLVALTWSHAAHLYLRRITGLSCSPFASPFSASATTPPSASCRLSATASTPPSSASIAETPSRPPATPKSTAAAPSPPQKPSAPRPTSTPSSSPAPTRSTSPTRSSPSPTTSPSSAKNPSPPTAPTRTPCSPPQTPPENSSESRTTTAGHRPSSRSATVSPPEKSASPAPRT